MLDKKGLLAEQTENCKALNISHLEIGQSEISIRDHEDKEKATNIVAVTFNRLSFISFKINSIEGFYSTFKKIHEAVVNILGELNIRRIGCRIIGTYMVKSKDYNSVLNNFKSSFPAKFLIDQYPAKDFSISLSSTVYRRHWFDKLKCSNSNIANFCGDTLHFNILASILTI